MLPDLYIGFSRGRSGGLVFLSLSEFSTVYCDPHSQSLDIVNKGEIDVFLELSCFFNDPEDVGNLISSSSERESESEVAQSCLTLCDPVDCIPPGSPVPEILQARTLEWFAISFSNA